MAWFFYTPKSKWVLMTLMVVTYLIEPIPTQYSFRLESNYFVSIGQSPISGGPMMAYLYGWAWMSPLWLLLILLCIWRYAGQVSLWKMNWDRPIWTVTWSSILWTLAVITAYPIYTYFRMLVDISDLPHYLIFAAYSIWLAWIFLCARSAIVFKAKHESGR